MKPLSWLGWAALAVVAAFCLGAIALHRGETINAIWLVVASASIFTIAFRFYGLYIARNALVIDPSRATPAWRRNDGLDFVPTPKSIVFGHHFAAIAGAGPLVGPVLAAQMGFLPGTLWILFGVVLAGAVQDMLVLFFSTRRDGKSLGEMIRAEMGPTAGVVSMIGILMIMVILLAVLALVVVKALADSPWGTFTVAMTIPIAILMGLYLRHFRPGRILEVSVIGFVLLLLAIWAGGKVATSEAWAPMFHLKGTMLAWLMIGYGFIAAVLPVWFLLAPRDYLSTFLKIGTILALAVAIIFAMPELKMPAVTKFIDGTGPVFAGSLFPFLFITIACGSVSGFHALISSGTTPKLISSEADIPVVGYGGMLMEAFVAIMALIAACVLDPGVYFSMNAPAALLGTTVESAATAVSNLGFVVTPDMLAATAKEIGETTILSRTGGAPTLAVGMAQILHGLIPGEGMMAFWYHYAILFEALFILTTIDAGTRVARFMIQELVGLAYEPFRRTESWAANLTCTAIAVALWGYFLYQGVVDPLGGINTLWPLFGIANQMLAGIALVFCSVVMVKMKREKFLWIPLIPTAWLLVCTLVAGWQKLFHEDPKIGFIANARKFADAAARGEVLAPAKSMEDMSRVILNNYIDAGLCALFVAVVVATVFFGIRAALAARSNNAPTSKESDYVAVDAVAP
ncbi:carbon starvation CstA family protein [Lysobacter sp. Root494]|uniref:carbon starvation CstA family protein n=1 Tax=Lysobacter sp. Root494 TaxID=1736549 RepID=UPI0006FD56D4|nr:carbon starvation CstA family protein [Lysobacter sp. Root494]KQY51122.1 carbon starvation protein A [Lysobacter sp. Root494]